MNGVGMRLLMISKRLNRAEWHAWFAWFPIDTFGGRWVWLEWVERKWTQDAGISGGYDGYGWTSDGYTYRLPRHECN